MRIYKSVGDHAAGYFTNALKTEGNYLRDSVVQAHWEGKTAEFLGISGREVTYENFRDVTNNIHPITKLRLKVRNVENSRAGFDITFSVPKSVSILQALTNDPEILRAHRYAYRKAISEIEARMQTQANNKYGRGYEHTGNVLFSVFDHFTTRPNKVIADGKTQYLPDPQLHSHVFIPNVTWSHKKKRVQALEMGNLYTIAAFLEATYHSHLSKKLNEIGYLTERTHERYEVVGVSHLIDRFSNRTKLIEKVAREKGIIDPKKKGELGARTRLSKSKSVSEDELFDHWKNRLSDSEFSDLQKIKGLHKNASDRISVKEAVDLSLEHFLERNSTAVEKRVIAHALTLGYGHLLPEDVQKELEARDNIIRSRIDTVSHITTREMVQAEDAMLTLATEGKGRHKPLNPKYQTKLDFLNQQQKSAIKEILSSSDMVAALKGSAGAGKTTLLKEVATAVQQSGKSLFAVAPSTQATDVLRQNGFKADTLAALLHNPKLQQQLKDNVLVLDEAGTVGVRNMSQVLSLVKQQNGRLILSGDTRQHGPPGQYGDALRLLQEKAKIKTAQVNKVMRQKPEEYRKAVEKLAKGQTLEGYQALDRQGAVQEIPDHDKRMETIASDYVKSVIKNRKALIIAPTHIEGEALTEIVRQKLREKGHIKGKDRVFETLTNLSFTQSQKKDLVNYKEGQIIRFIKNQPGGLKAGGHYTVLPKNKDDQVIIRHRVTGQKYKLPSNNPEHFQVYSKKQREIASGDLIRLTNNSKTVENTKITNGTTHGVKGFTKSGDIRLESGKTLSKEMGHWTHGIAETSHSSQGKTCKEVFISISDNSFVATNAQTLYVSASRATHSAKLYTSDKGDLKRSIMRSGERMSATDLADDHQRQLLLKKQQRYYKSNEKSRQHEKQQKRDRTPERGI